MKKIFITLALLTAMAAPAAVFAEESDAQDAQFMQDKSDIKFKDDLSEVKEIKKDCKNCSSLGLSPTLVAAIEANKKNKEAQAKGNADLGRRLLEEYKKDSAEGKGNIGKKADSDYFNGDFAAAIKNYSDLLAGGKNVEGIFIKRGMAYAKSKDRAKALADYEQAKKLVNPVLFGYQLAELAAALGKYDEAAYYLDLRISQEKKRDPGYVSQSDICPILDFIGQSVAGCVTVNHSNCALMTQSNPSYGKLGCAAIKQETDYLLRVGAMRAPKGKV